MGIEAIKWTPGITAQQSETYAELRWFASSGIRWKDGCAQKDGGFLQIAGPLAVGVPSAIKAWNDLSGTNDLAVAGTIGVAVVAGGLVNNITPYTKSYTLNIPFTTTAGSATIVVTDATYNPGVSGGWVTIRNPVSVGGIHLSGPYFATYIGATQYSIQSTLTAKGAVANGGTARQFSTQQGSGTITIVLPSHGQTTGQVTLVADPVSVGGTVLQGDYVITVMDQNTYTIQTTAIPVATASVFEENGNVAFEWYAGNVQQNWNAQSVTLDTWGEDLMVCAQGGPVCVWLPETPNTPATPIPTAPQANTGVLVATQEQILVCFGSVNLTTDEFDPLLIDWSDVGDYTDFIPSTTNQAGSFRIPSGSRLMGALPIGLQILVWTDVTLYVMQYIGFPLVFGFNPTNLNCGLIGVHAAGVLGGIVFWMSQNQFFVLSSAGPQILPCAVWDQVFKNLDLANAFKSFCWTNTFFNEVNWYYPSLNGGGEVDSFVRFQVDQQAWIYGPITGIDPPILIPTRTAGIDQSVFGAPIAASSDGRVFQHEVGNDADGAPLQTYLISGAVMISEGDDFVAVDQIIPDFKYGIPGAPQIGNLDMNFYFYDWSQENPRSCGPYLSTPTTQVIPVKGRGRQMQIEMSGNDLGSFWRLAALRFRGKPNGKR